MNHDIPSPSRTSTFNENDLRRIEIALTAFRVAWESGRNPLIEQFLQTLPESLQAAGLSELLLLEFGLRRAAGEVISPANYSNRFPNYREKNSELIKQAPHPLIPSDSKATTFELNDRVETNSPAQQPLIRSQSVTEKIERTPKAVPEEFGRYKILRELGRGGMGAVYLALDRQLGRNVALKIPHFRDDDDADAVERFYREARTMATVQHANLCPVFDVGLFEQWHFLTMAFIDGQPLSTKLKEEGAIPVIEALTLLKTVAMAVQKAHEAGIIHRDLKPANIMLNRDGDPIIMDFGLARRRLAGEVELTHTGAVFGSPAFMAPEQVEARHHEIGPATDIYALGVILYQMVTGRRPFEGSVMSVFGKILSQIPVAPSIMRRDLPLEIDSICMMALAKSPAKRQSTAAMFADELSSLASSLLRHSSSEVKTITYRPVPDPQAELLKENDPASISRSRREAELRQVTVAVFNYEADDSSLNASRSSYSEMLHEQSHSFTAYVTGQITRMGGVVVQGSGPEVIACFGFPQALEDAPQRAVRMALQVMRDLTASNQSGLNLPQKNQVWVVLHSGEAVAEELDSPQGTGIALVGDARNTAMRLNSIAEPGSIVISGATHTRVALFFQCESLGPQRVRGMTQPIELFKVIKEAASRNRVDLADPGNLSPLVGRDTELSILKDRWEQAIDGLGQIVLLIGDAGLGKSRLIRELREHVIDLDVEQAAVIEWRCSQYQQGTSFFPVVEFLSRLLDFENLSVDQRLDTVVRYLHDWKIESDENVSLLCGLLNVPTDHRFPALALSPQKMKERTESLLLQWLKQLVNVSPLLFIVEDLHWLDPSTLELLEKHVEEFETGRMLSLLTFRPEFETPWKSKPHQTQIALNRLTKRQIGEMMRKRTKRKEIPEPILQQVIERTDGIPLFVEEFTVVIVESGILDRSDAGTDSASLLNVIPATLHDLLLSRLDRMEADREVIQLAATIGREFSFRLLSAACTLPEGKLQAELDKLVNAEILFQKGEAQDATYIFKHALLQDAAYRSILTKKRQMCHRRIAEVLEMRFKDVVNSQPALLAHHFTEAGIISKGVQYWLRAGQKSQEQSANIEAIGHLTRGVTILQTLPETPDRDQMELALQITLFPVLTAARGWSAPEVGTAIERAQQLSSRIGTVADQFFVTWGLWGWRVIRSDLDIAEDIAGRMMQLVQSSPESSDLLSEAYWAVGCTAYYKGEFIKGLDLLDKAVSLVDDERERSHALKTGQCCSVMCGTHGALALWQMGFPDQALQRAEIMVRRAKQLNHPFTLAMSMYYCRQIVQFCGLDDRAIVMIEEEYAICHEQGFVFFEVHAIFGRADLLVRKGKIDESRPLFEQGLQMLKAIAGNLSMEHPYRNNAEAFVLAGRPDDANEWLQRGFDLANNHNQRTMESEFFRLKGELALAAGDETKAEACYQKAREVSQQQSAKSWELRATMSLAKLRQLQGKPDEGRQLLASVYNFFSEGFETMDLKAARSLLNELDADA